MHLLLALMIEVSGEIPCVFGGGPDLNLDTTECYNLTTRTWIPLSVSLQNLSDRVAFNFGGVACVIATYSNTVPRMWCMNGSVPWIPFPNPPTQRRLPTPIYGNGWIGVVGQDVSKNVGWDMSQVSGEVTLESTFNWTISGLLNYPSIASSPIAINGTPCVIGGVMNGSIAGDGTCLTEMRWKSLQSSLLIPRYSATTLSFPGKWCVAGGRVTPTAVINSVECIDDLAQTNWTNSTLSLPFPVGAAVNFSFVGLTCIGGGSGSGGPIKAVICGNYSIADGEIKGWVSVPTFSQARSGHVSFLLESLTFPEGLPPVTLADVNSPLTPGTWKCVVGGFDGQAIYDTECFNESSQTWHHAPILNLPLTSNRTWDLSSFNLGPVVCLTGPLTRVICTNGSVEWSERTPLLTPRGGAAALYGGGVIALAGGYVKWPTMMQMSWEQSFVGGNTSFTNDVNFSWASSGLAPARVWPVALPINGTLCVVGGGYFRGNGTIDAINTSTCARAGVNNFIQGPNLTTARYSAFTLQMPGGVWCVGGGVDSSANSLLSVECINGTGPFKVNPNLTYPNIQNAVGAVNISLFGMTCITGGRMGWSENVSPEVWCINTSAANMSSPWLPLTGLLSPRAQHSSFVLQVGEARSVLTPPSFAPTFGPAPTASPPTLAPTITLGGVVIVVSDPQAGSGGAMSSSSPPPGQAIIQIVIDPITNQSSAVDIANRLITAIYLQLLQINASSSSSQLIGGSTKVTVTVVNNTATNKKPTYVVVIQTDENTAQDISTVLNNKNNNDIGGGGGYTITGIHIRWPSVTTLLEQLPKTTLIIILSLLGIIILLLVGLHIRAKDMNGLISIANVMFTISSFILCVWLFTVLKTAATTNYDDSSAYHHQQNVNNVTAVNGTIFIPYFIAFTVALFMTPILNALALCFQWKRIVRNDHDFQLWVNIHPNLTAITIFLCLFSISNIFAITAQVMMGERRATMASQSRLSFAALGIWGGVFELPRIVIQFILIGLYPSQNTAAAAWLPLSLATLSFFSTVLQRCYALGYIRGKTNPGAISLQGIN